MEDTRFGVEFGEHVSLERVRDMTAGLGAYGSVERSDDNPRRYLVSVFRPSKVEGLKAQLGAWERYGSLSWSAAT